MGPVQESVVLRRPLLGVVSYRVRMRTLLLALAGVALSASAADPTMDDRAAQAAREGLSRKGEFKPDVKVPEYDRERVKTLSDTATQRGVAELDRLRAKQGGFGDNAGAPGKRDADANSATVAGRVVVALSSSMPDAMLASYMQQLDRRRESLVVLRGFVGGAHQAKPTGILMEKIRRKVAGDRKSGHYLVETVVDPLFFQQLGIDKVPAVVYLDDVQSLAHCDQEDYSKATVVYGAVSIEAALKEARKAGATVPDSVIAKYRGSGWERRP